MLNESDTISFFPEVIEELESLAVDTICSTANQWKSSHSGKYYVEYVVAGFIGKDCYTASSFKGFDDALAKLKEILPEGK